MTHVNTHQLALKTFIFFLSTWPPISQGYLGYFIGVGAGGLRGRGVKLTTHIQPMPRLKIRGATPPRPVSQNVVVLSRVPRIAARVHMILCCCVQVHLVIMRTLQQVYVIVKCGPTP